MINYQRIWLEFSQLIKHLLFYSPYKICKHSLISIDFIASVYELFDNPSSSPKLTNRFADHRMERDAREMANVPRSLRLFFQKTSLEEDYFTLFILKPVKAMRFTYGVG